MATNELQAFINHVQAQRGKKITESAADELIAQAQSIIADLTPPTATPTATQTPLARLPGDIFPVSLKLPPSSRVQFDAPFYAIQQQTATVTIDYVYDPLYRLTEANYLTGDSYHYAYDAVGNRLTQTRMVNGLSSVVNYVYDDANRLKTMTSPSVNASYAYNGMGDRLQQIHNGQTTTFTMDLNTGLTQALNDGTNNYIYGNGRIAQVNTGTEYFLGDALGSVRQLTNTSGAITYASMYDPYGVTTQTHGASQTAYGFTGEYTSNDLVYLRARYYAPGMGRFLTRDTWQGNANQPMSFNRWNYVEANPVNYTDPSGHFPTFCQSMPTKGLYELCVLGYYGLEPISYFELGERVQGSQGCYSGPSEYRAPGYLEGVEGHFGGIPSYTTGLEVVYDFANMQRARFKFQGITVNDGLVGGGVSVYFGKALGLRSDKRLPDYYKDVSLSYSVGMSFDIIIGGAIGRGGFVALSSETLPMLRGNTWYTGASVSADAFEGLDLSGSWVNYTPVSDEPDRYVLGGKLNETRLYSDITSGSGSPWESQWEFIGNYPPIFVDKMIVRAYGLHLAHKYVRAYKELHNENP